MLQDIYYSRRSNKAVQVIAQCRMLPDGTEAVCFQEMSGDYEVFVLAKEHFMRIFQKMDVEEDDLKQDAVNQTKENMEEKNAADQPEESQSDSSHHELSVPGGATVTTASVDQPKTEESVKEIVGSEKPHQTISRPASGDLFTLEEIMNEPEEIVTEEEEVVPGIIQFLDAETYEDKMKVLESMRDELDERTLNNMAVSLDLTINSGVDAYSFLMSELRIRSRYEGKRGQRL